MATRTLDPTWDLDAIFPGGSRSTALEQHVEALKGQTTSLEASLEGLPVPATLKDARVWGRALDGLISAYKRLTEAGAFVGCLTAANVDDEEARLWAGRLMQLEARLESIGTSLDRFMLEMPDGVWRALLEEEPFRNDAFALNTRRRRAHDRMKPELETLVSDLGVDGYHGWNELYELISGRLQVAYEKDGKIATVSAGQAENQMENPDRSIRQAVFAGWEKAWAGQAELCAAALNHLSGFRLGLYRHRGWTSILKEPLEESRMSEATLRSMWGACEEARPRLKAYMSRRAEFMGIPALSWFDLSAPLQAEQDQVTYDGAAEFIIEQFGRFHPAMAQFAEGAFEGRWIEAEDRPGKAPGGFCAGFPLKKQSRIFMTFGGTTGGMRTLTHELGHAYHGHVVRDLSPLSQAYPMPLAETASTFAEAIVADAAIRATSDASRRLALLDDRLRTAVSFIMNIHARFLFETRFYAARAEGPVGVGELNALMETAQREAYADALDVVHPYFWASKLHFYITGLPFYNFPYTFGYLFSAGVYGRALSEGPSFAARYDALLRDTGRMTVEELANRHLDADLTQPEFWRQAIDQALADLDEFMKLTARAVP